MRPLVVFCLLLSSSALAGLPDGAIQESTVEALPGTRPLIKRTYRPPNYETPLQGLDSIFTPNDQFFVRYHLSNIPEIRLEDWKLKVGGEAAGKTVTYTAQELQHDFKQVEVAAVAYCSGNQRGLVQPHVPGVQWSFGAMGNAKWRGVRLRDVLERSGLKPGAVEVVFDGADGPALDKTPDFRKSIPLAKALDPDTLIAFEMNGQPLPKNQGFPARIVVPGWTATYWVKHLISIEAVSKPYDGYWMKSAYRIPRGKFSKTVEGRWPGQETPTTIPITEIAVSSLITNLEDQSHVPRGKPVAIRGLTWDGGHGIVKVETSIDGGKHWRLARLGKNYGNYSWRQFTATVTPSAPGPLTLMARATNRIGDTQPPEAVQNPAGYHHNVIQTLNIEVDP